MTITDNMLTRRSLLICDSCKYSHEESWIDEFDEAPAFKTIITEDDQIYYVCPICGTVQSARNDLLSY